MQAAAARYSTAGDVQWKGGKRWCWSPRPLMCPAQFTAPHTCSCAHMCKRVPKARVPRCPLCAPADLAYYTSAVLCAPQTLPKAQAPRSAPPADPAHKTSAHYSLTDLPDEDRGEGEAEDDAESLNSTAAAADGKVGPACLLPLIVE